MSKISGSKDILRFGFDDESYVITASIHARERMMERDVEEGVVSSSIVALGSERLEKLCKTNDEAIVIDSDEGVSVVAGFLSNNKIFIKTVIDKKNVWNKRGTRIERI